MILECTKKRFRHIEKKLSQLNKEIAKLPDGKLVCYRNGKGKGVKWYHVIDSKRDWIYKKNRELACKLAHKKLLQARVADLTTEKKLIENLYFNESNSVNYSIQTEQVLNDPFLSDLLTGAFLPRNVAMREWANAEYNRNLMYPEQLIHPTLTGIKVRSKSESTIERVLAINKIAFRYECALELNGAIYFPDFMILHPRTEELVIWEHFGIMDNREYIQKTFRKLEQYCLNGYRIGERLIATFESKDHPLGFDEAEEKVLKYLLS